MKLILGRQLKFIGAILILLAGVIRPGNAAEPFSILGIKIGDDFYQTQERYGFTTGKNGGTTDRVTESLPGTLVWMREYRFVTQEAKAPLLQENGTIAETWLFNNSSPLTGDKIVKVGRGAEFGGPIGPSTDGVIQALTDKYGEPRYRETNSDEIYLFWQDGKSWYISDCFERLEDPPLKTKPIETCGTALSVTLRKKPNGTIEMIKMVLHDHRQNFNLARADKQLIADLLAKERAEKDQALQNKFREERLKAQPVPKL